MKVVAFILLAFFSISNANESIDKERKIYKCEGKKYCKQMLSCKEAMFYLNTCGVKRLDRDKDGIPCERICKGHKR